jgi:hypothetical protein
LGPELKTTLGKKDATTILGDEWVGMRQLAAGLVYLEASTAGEPHCGDAVVIEGGSEFVEARGALSRCWKQVINRDV